MAAGAGGEPGNRISEENHQSKRIVYIKSSLRKENNMRAKYPVMEVC